MDFERIDRGRNRRSVQDLALTSHTGSHASLLPPHFAAAIEKVLRP
jgi:hypothetical protein